MGQYYLSIHLVSGSLAPKYGVGLGGLILGGLGQESASDAPDPVTTIIVGQAITADSIPVAFAGTTLTTGAPRMTVDGTLLNSAG